MQNTKEVESRDTGFKSFEYKNGTVFRKLSRVLSIFENLNIFIRIVDAICRYLVFTIFLRWSEHQPK